MQSALITANELINSLETAILLDASMQKPMRFIKGARLFDVDIIADTSSPYPHMLPDEATFTAHARALGLSNDDHIVIYDSTGVSFAAARAWWMFRAFGHDNVQVLNGGLPAWMQAGGATDTSPTPTPSHGDFTARFQPQLYRSYDDMVRISETGEEQIIDVRGAGRFNAMARSLDGDIVPAHIEGSLNLPFAAMLDPLGGAIIESSQLAQIFTQYTPNMGKKRVVMCASGITACVVALGFFQTGEHDVAVFDGSWIEWADRQGIR